MTTILIVEDDDAIRNNVTRMLKLEGFDIVSATNGRLGLERLRQVMPDVVISVDTYKPPVVAAVLEAGAHIVNDVSGLRAPELAPLVAEHRLPGPQIGR